jgi:hypothetical protein
MSWQKIVFEEPNWISIKGTDDRQSKMFCHWASDRKSFVSGDISNYEDYSFSETSKRKVVPKWLSQQKFEVAEYQKDKLNLKCSDFWGFNVEIYAQRIDAAEKPKLLEQKFRWVTETEEYMPKKAKE